MSINLITVHVVSKMYVLLLSPGILVDHRHARLVKESVAEVSRCVKKLVTVEQVCATSIFHYSSSCYISTENVFKRVEVEWLT